MITDRAGLAGLLMTPDAAFGYQRGGTPDTLAALGATADPAWDVDDRPAVRSSAVPRSARADIRAAIAPWRSPRCGQPARSCPTPIVGDAEPERDGTRLTFPMPVALPPDGDYAVRVGSPLDDGSPSRGRSTVGTVQGATVGVRGRVRSRRVRVAFVGSAVGG